MRSKSENALIDGPAGQLEIRFRAAENSEQAGLVVISHPHPQFGGTMNNKVVTTLEKAWQEKGYATVVYNFRGVGKSQGEYDGGIGEVDDLVAVVNWARRHFDMERLLLAGFSFGSYVTLKAQPLLQAERLMIVAPPVGLYNFAAIEEIQVPWELVIGLQDEVVEVAEMMQWFDRLQQKPTLYARAHASHFFHGQLLWLKRIILSEY
ncbi:alpha/beta hydrolase [Thiomicrorhabdus cannonii]|uniref:alpha/beta hydrolase n=1 Tax=Thiomicrorhabdus cannonii TaxID=2748011 RepID=UPI0015BFE64D|nr:alpha/beta fold hydrolase [Thiomicrorhabdus cannonii]